MEAEENSPAAPTGAEPLEEEASVCDWYTEGNHIVCGDDDRRIDIDTLAKEVEKAIARQIVYDKTMLTTWFEIEEITDALLSKKCGCEVGVDIRLDMFIYEHIMPRLPLYQTNLDYGKYREFDDYFLLLPRTITHRHWISKPDETLKEVLQRVQDFVALWKRHFLNSDPLEELEGCMSKLEAKWAVLNDAIAAILFYTYSSSDEGCDKWPRDWYYEELKRAYDLYDEDSA